jgi:hypothetical protein
LISDGAVSSSGDVVIYLSPLWRSLRWYRRRRIGAGFFHRFILSFQLCQVGMYVPCNLILSYERDTYYYAKKVEYIYSELPHSRALLIGPKGSYQKRSCKAGEDGGRDLCLSSPSLAIWREVVVLGPYMFVLGPAASLPCVSIPRPLSSLTCSSVSDPSADRAP